MSTNFIFKTNGNYIGFIDSEFIFSRDGKYLGWIDNKLVWDREGEFRGALMILGEKSYVLRSQLTMSALSKTPKIPSYTPEMPPPPPNATPISPGVEFIDAF